MPSLKFWFFPFFQVCIVVKLLNKLWGLCPNSLWMISWKEKLFLILGSKVCLLLNGIWFILKSSFLRNRDTPSGRVVCYNYINLIMPKVANNVGTYQLKWVVQYQTGHTIIRPDQNFFKLLTDAFEYVYGRKRESGSLGN